MFRLTIANRILFLIVLVFGFSLSVNAQADCAYGFRIYARDETGKAIQNAKLEVSALDAGEKLPSRVNFYVEKSDVYNIRGYGGRTVKGDFVLKISAEGLQPFERQFNFPICEVQSFELRLRPKGSAAKAELERLFKVHGKVFDEDRKPFGSAKVEARSADGRVYQATSNQYGYYEIELPKGVMNIRVSDIKIPDVVFDNYKVEKNYSVLNVPVCLKCKQKDSKN